MRKEVLFLPEWNVGNPYQELLMTALKENGVDVIIDNYQKQWPVLYRSIRKHKNVKIIHLHWIGPYLFWIFLSTKSYKRKIRLLFCFIDILLVKLSGRKIVWSIHNALDHESKDYFLEKRFRRMLLMIVNRIFVHNKTVIKKIEDDYGINIHNKTAVIPHGNYINCYPNTINRESARRRLKLDIDKKVFLYFGTIRSYKGVEDLIEEFNNNVNLEDSTLILAGKPFNDEIKQSITQLVKDSVNISSFFHFIPDDDIQIFMNAANVVVFPFKQILTSGSVILAMSFGKAVIVPRKGSLPELLDDDGAIFFDEIGDFKRVFERTLTADLDKMGTHNKMIIEKYDWKMIGEKLSNDYRGLMR